MSEQSRTERRARSAEISQRDAELASLLSSDKQIIPSDQCEEGYLYYGFGRSIGQVAVCRGNDKHGKVKFVGLRNKFGVDYLFEETHFDDDSSIGTWIPVLRLEPAPECIDEETMMSWILDRYIEMLELRVEWVESMPPRLRECPSYEIVLEQAKESLHDMKILRHEGFSKTPWPTFREMMEKKKSGTQPLAHELNEV
jgi:hypothetical protein